MSPAEEMRAAAERLRDRVAAFRTEAKTNPYWAGTDFAAGVNNAMGGAGGELAALLTPALAEHLAVLLDATAAEISRLAGDLTEAELAKYDRMTPTWLPALAVARHLLDTFPSSS